jgi:hypothetical protein
MIEADQREEREGREVRERGDADANRARPMILG